MSDLREQIEAEITSIKLEIERLKSLAKKRMSQPRDLEEVTHRLRALRVRISELEHNLEAEQKNAAARIDFDGPTTFTKSTPS